MLNLCSFVGSPRAWRHGAGLLALCLGLASPASANYGSANFGALKVSGNKIVNAANACPVFLKGVDIPSMEWQNAGEGPTGTTNGVLSTAQNAVNNWGVNIIRVPLNQDRWLGSTACSGLSQSAYWALVDAIVAWCQANNCYVLLDLHWSDENQGGAQCASAQHSMPDNGSVTFWTSLATHYANNPAVLFDLFNEPEGFTSWSLWKGGGTTPEGYATPGMQKLVNTIRDTGAKNVITAGGLNWAFDLSGVPSNALTDANTAGTLTGNGIVYATHIYPWKSSPGACLPSNSCVTGAIPAAVYNNYAVMVTEFGQDANNSQQQALTAGSVVAGTWSQDVINWAIANTNGYVAWSSSIDACPCLITNWNYTSLSTDFGATVVPDLQSANPVLAACGGGTATFTPTRTSTPTGTRTSTPTGTRTSTPTSTAVPPTATLTATRTPTPTSTAVPPTATLTATRTSTPTSTAVPPTATLTATRTPTPTSTAVPPTATLTATRTSTPTSTAVPPTATSTATPVVSATPTITGPIPTLTATPTVTLSGTALPPTGTSTATSTATSSRTSTPTSTTVPPTATWTSTLVVSATPTSTGPIPTSTNTTVPTLVPTSTSVPPPATTVPTLVPTSTSVPPTATTVPTSTSVPPTATTAPTLVPTSTSVPPTATTAPTPYALRPLLNSVAPGQAASGDSVTLQGSGFYPGATVSLGGQALLNVVVVDAGTITGTLPSLPAGTVSVVVTNLDGQFSQAQPLIVTVKPVATPTGPLKILAVQPVPQPNPTGLAVELSVPADRVVVRLWTRALVLAGSFSGVNARAGWQTLAFPVGFFSGLANGAYFVTVEADLGPARAVTARPARLVLIR